MIPIEDLETLRDELELYSERLQRMVGDLERATAELLSFGGLYDLCNFEVSRGQTPQSKGPPVV